jgi:hypothetical protein
MFENPVQAHIALAQLQGLKRQYDAFSETHVKLSHIYVEYPYGARPPLRLPSLMDEYSPFVSKMPYASSHVIYFNGSWIRLECEEREDRRECAGWYHGQGISEFMALAFGVDRFLSEFPLRIPMPRPVIQIANLCGRLSPDPIILPGGSDRWARTLHWLAWAGEVMAIRPLCYKEGLRSECEYSLDPGLSLGSIIDNLFLRSSLALDWIAVRMGLISLAPGIRRAKSRPKRRGRPVDTDVAEDRRIADAWETRRYRSLEELATAFRTNKDAVKAALDRHRKRAKSDGRNPPQ